MKCGLCLQEAPFFQEVSDKSYFECACCGLVFLDPSRRLASGDELAQYTLHQNSPEDKNYRKFLMPALEAVQKNLPRGGRGLDFGCGPGPTLSVMLEEVGYKMKNFDKYFYPEREVLTEQYDFITCTEVIEHIADLKSFLEELLALLRPQGLLVVMTKILQVDTDFKSWHYRIDPTHISFLRPQTVKLLGERFNLTLLDLTGQLIVLQKSEKAGQDNDESTS